jgi:hypothetical protein
MTSSKAKKDGSADGNQWMKIELGLQCSNKDFVECLFGTMIMLSGSTITVSRSRMGSVWGRGVDGAFSAMGVCGIRPETKPGRFAQNWLEGYSKPDRLDERRLFTSRIHPK